MHEFRFDGEWFGGFDGHGVIASGNLSTVISRPGAMGGPGKGTNPDELLVSAAGACYLMSLSYFLQEKDIGLVKVEVDSIGKFEVNPSGVRFRELTHHADITLAKAIENQDEVISKILHQAEGRCMVSQALQNNVKISVVPTVRFQSR